MTTGNYMKKFNSIEELFNILNGIEITPNQISDFNDYTIRHIKKLKLMDYKKFKVKLTDDFLQREGFNVDEIDKILGRTVLKKIETEEEDELVFG